MQQQKIQGLGGLTLYHALISKKEFNVKSSKSNAKSNSRLRISWYYSYRFTDHKGNLLLKPPFKQVKNVYEVANNLAVIKLKKVFWYF
uniref:Uncharacterized protein n=1 Tax=Rhizophagus irregularis (strain DAOM 181602 / DAOM 197198 / MUCL 43194) TaxID=747089 RepID=U9TML0_RHIID